MMSSQITRQSNYNSTPYCLDKVNALRLGLTCSCCCLRPMHIYTLYLPLVLYRYEGPSCNSRLPGACSIIVYNVQMRTFSSFPSLVGSATKHSSSTVDEPTDAPRVHRDVALTQHLHLKKKKKNTLAYLLCSCRSKRVQNPFTARFFHHSSKGHHAHVGPTSGR